MLYLPSKSGYSIILNYDSALWDEQQDIKCTVQKVSQIFRIKFALNVYEELERKCCFLKSGNTIILYWTPCILLRHATLLFKTYNRTYNVLYIKCTVSEIFRIKFGFKTFTRNCIVKWCSCVQSPQAF